MVRVVGDSIQEENLNHFLQHFYIFSFGIGLIIAGAVLGWWDRRQEEKAKQTLLH